MNQKNHKTIYGDNHEDRLISDLVRSVKYRVPEDVDRSLNHKMTAALHEKNNRPVRRGRRFRFIPRTALTAAMLMFMALLTVVLNDFLLRQPLDPNKINHVTANTVTVANKPINEIKTEFEIKSKNIKILWVQKQNFKLRRTQP